MAPQSKSDPLRLVIVVGHECEQERAAWQDDENGPLEQMLAEIAVEVVTMTEVNYREGLGPKCNVRSNKRLVSGIGRDVRSSLCASDRPV